MIDSEGYSMSSVQTRKNRSNLYLCVTGADMYQRGSIDGGRLKWECMRPKGTSKSLVGRCRSFGVCCSGRVRKICAFWSSTMACRKRLYKVCTLSKERNSRSDLCHTYITVYSSSSTPSKPTLPLLIFMHGDSTPSHLWELAEFAESTPAVAKYLFYVS